MPRGYLTPKAVYDAAIVQAHLDACTRNETIFPLPLEQREAAYAESNLVFDRDVAAAQAAYDCAIAAQTRAILAADRAAYERRHGPLDGYPAWRSEDVETARAELRGEAA